VHHKDWAEQDRKVVKTSYAKHQLSMDHDCHYYYQRADIIPIIRNNPLSCSEKT
jgi:hypothetical protein